MKVLFIGVLAAALALTARAVAQIPFGTTPGWTSLDVSNYSTGAGWADINRDGRPDLVVANGNDMARRHVTVYYNGGAAPFPSLPQWQSADVDYHGRLAIADVNGDGYPDVAVSVYLGATGFTARGRVKLYMNNGGTLTTSPVWTSRDSFYTFGCAFGDADGDGDPDLAVATGEAYGSRPEKNRIYYNRGGVLDSLPGWQTAASTYSYDVAWADVDNDGDLDLIYACERGPNLMFRNYRDSIGTVPAWISADTSRFANSLCVADADSDGYRDLAVSDNHQLGGSGRFKMYRNISGSLEATPSWESATAGAGSGIALADIDADGRRDLIVGGWWEPLRIFRNRGETFPVVPDWTSATGSVVEMIACRDVDGDAVDSMTVLLTGDGNRTLFALPRAPFQTQPLVIAGTDTLSPGQFWCDIDNGWLSLASAPPVGLPVEVHLLASHDLDFAVSNWDPAIGNYIFYNTTVTTDVRIAGDVPVGVGLGQNYPNPFNGETNIGYRIQGTGDRGGLVTLKVYDVLGREVKTLVQGSVGPGEHTAILDAGGLPSGVYLYRLEAGSFVAQKKMILLR